MTRRLFVTGSGTDVGKTFVTCAVIRALRAANRTVRALKPIASGFDPLAPGDSDAARLLDALGLPSTPEHLDAVSPWRFRAPLSPDMAAAREHRVVPFDAVIELCGADTSADVTLIEGVGGVMAPLDDAHTVLDWIAALGAPAVLVTGSYLGALSHTLTAAAALAARGCRLAVVVVSESEGDGPPGEETAAVLRRFVATAPVQVLPRGRPEAVDWLGLVELGEAHGRPGLV